MCNLEVLGLNKEVKFAVYVTPKTPGIWALVMNVIIQSAKFLREKFLSVDRLQIYMESDLFSAFLLCHGLLLASKLDVQVSFGVVGHCSLLV